METTSIAEITYQPSVTLTLDQQKEYMRAFEHMKRSVLVEGRDYATIPGTPKPTLLKPGAEHLLIACGMTHTVDLVEKVEDWDNGFFYYRYKCTVSKYVNGVRLDIAACEGSANSKERRYRNQDVFSVVNTLQKMAIKRALVGATLQATATSGLFTQDIEDMDMSGSPDDQDRSHVSSSQGSESPRRSAKDAATSERQLRHLYSVATTELGMTAEEFQAWVHDTYGVGSPRDLTVAQASAAMDALKKLHETGEVHRSTTPGLKPGACS